jgi:hypothetical protein
MYKMKICSKCRIEKDVSEFYSNKSRTDGLASDCIECKKVYHSNPEVKRRFELYRATPEAKARVKAYNATPKARISKDLYEKDRLLKDPEFKLKKYLRARIKKAIKGKYKSGSAVKDAGAPMDVVRKHIESLFYGEMTWENWGPYWELDHVQSLASFDLPDREQFLRACHYTNLQPLTKEDHRLKTIKQDWRKVEHYNVAI